MFNNQRITRLENKVKLLIEDTLEQYTKIMSLETELVLLRKKVKDMKKAK